MKEKETIIALAGNPNVGKSTVFNALTGMHQHTGNWPGKTVSNANGYYEYNNKNYRIYDLPGVYSLLAHSEEEVVARDFLCFEKTDIIIIVCDAVCLMRNLNLVLQINEIKDNVIVCVNLLDEAQKKKINIDLDKLSYALGTKVVGTSARNKEGLEQLLKTIDKFQSVKMNNFKIKYNSSIERAIKKIEEVLSNINIDLNKRWIALNLLKENCEINEKIKKYCKIDIEEKELQTKIKEAKRILLDDDILITEVEDLVVETINNQAEKIAQEVTTYGDIDYNKKDRKIDKILTNKLTGIPIMLLLFAFIFWLTIIGSNYPSSFLQKFLFGLEDNLLSILKYIHIPNVISKMLVLGIYRVLSWVISVMLPPMAIFFPLFTLLEDVGYLPRIAFNLDGIFKKCKTCGKQALTMAMGFGCNSVGVSGCRIIDSPRERLIAIITNSFVPCNGRFPSLIAIITMFFAISNNGIINSFFSTILLIITILLSIFMTFIISRLLSKTLLKGIPSSFTLELPPYRKPQIGKVIIRSIFDRTIFVLGRAISIAIPAGAIIWLMANVYIKNNSLLIICSNFLNPLGTVMGMDGVILLAFILGFPANEIVIPIIIMGYMSTGSLVDINNLNVLKELFINNGWTWTTAVSVMLFSLMHWPCSTTCLTIKKETNSIKWTILSIVLPTLCGMIICILFNTIIRIFI